jgi:plastocyanin
VTNWKPTTSEERMRIPTTRHAHGRRRGAAVSAAAAVLAVGLAGCATDADESGAAAPGDTTSDADDEAPAPVDDLAADEAQEPDAPDDEGSAATVVSLDDADGFVFEPDSVDVAVGDTVTWEHVGSISHTVTASDDTFDSGTLAAGDTFAFTFEEAGTYEYVCDFHGNMRGTVTVS